MRASLFFNLTCTPFSLFILFYFEVYENFAGDSIEADLVDIFLDFASIFIACFFWGFFRASFFYLRAIGS